MRGNKIIIIIVVSAVMAAIGFWRYAGGFLGGNNQKTQFQPSPKTESVKSENKNSGSIDLVRPPFLDE
jgi:hypothetical protein